MRMILRGTEVWSGGCTGRTMPKRAYGVGRYAGAILETEEWMR